MNSAYMLDNQPLAIDLNQKDAVKQILPRAPILSSRNTGWHGIHLEYHRQPPHETPYYCFPHHILSIGLRYQAKEFKVNGRVHTDFVVGNVGICPASQSLKTQAYGNAEFILLSLEPSNFARSAYETVDIDQVEIVQQVKGHDPLIYQIGLALKTELESSGGVDSCLYAESMATALSVHLLRRYLARKQIFQDYTGGLPQYKLREAIAYINEHLDQSLHLAEIAAIVQISPHYFASLFKQSTGFAPHQYVTKCRIEKAKRLLKRQELTIVEICQQVGFQSQSHFTKVFRQHTLTTPKVYRDKL
jgi:AraC family transcriptional regulator